MYFSGYCKLFNSYPVKPGTIPDINNNAKQSCVDDKELISGLCYEKCKDGYHKRPGDIISCWKT